MAASSNAEGLRISLLSPSDTDTDHDGQEGEDADMGAGVMAFVQHNRTGGGRRKQNGTRSRPTERVPLISISAGANPVASSPFLERSTYFTNEFSDHEFGALVRASEMAIDSGVDPVRISQGSSGSYFVKNTDGVSESTDFLPLSVVAGRASCHVYTGDGCAGLQTLALTHMHM